MAASMRWCLLCGMSRKFSLWKSSSPPATTVHYSIARCFASSATDENTEIVPSRKMKESENVLSLKHNIGMLKKHVSIDTKKSYKPPADVEERCRKILEATVDRDTLQDDWESASLNDPKMKYWFLTKLIREFDHDIPGVFMTDMKCVKDAVRYFAIEVRATSAYEDLASRRDLPPNLHVQPEPIRFNPETDTLFGGRTAFPDRDTIVTSIKARRKYSDIKNVKERPGYIHPYYDY